MDANIDTLSIQVSANASSASKNIGKLQAALESLGKVIDKSPLHKLSALADELEEIARLKGKNVKELSDGLDKLNKSADKASKSSEKIGSAFSTIKAGATIAVFKRIGSYLASFTKESNSYIENLNLFTVSMRDHAEEALAYSEKVQKALGIDQSMWIRYQGLFNNIATGFGVVSDKAALISQNLTQIGYDISSFFNISVEEAMNKVRSGISGELEPLRNLGYALDKATLQQIAYEKGIHQSIDTMTQAQKSQLRYVAILEQSKNVMGDMARTIQTPANALRVLDQQFTMLKRTIGNLLLPLLQAALPYLQAAVTLLTEWLASISSFTLPEIDYSGLEGANSLIDDTTEALDDATSAAKKLSATLGIDELNIISPNSGKGLGDEDGLAFDLPLDLPSYDFLKGLAKQADDAKERLKALWAEWGGLIRGVAIGAASLWVGKKVISGITLIPKVIERIKDAFAGLNGKLLGAGGAVAGLALTITSARNLADVLASDDKHGLAGAIGGLVGGAVLTGAGTGLATGGWIGALIGALGGLAVGLVTVWNRTEALRVEMLKTDFYNVQGEAIADVRDRLNEMFSAMDFDKFSEWNQKVADAAQAYDDAAYAYNNLWFQLQNKDVWDDSDITNLADAFKNLADAASALNKVKFDNLFAGIKQAIDNNINPQLTGKLQGMVSTIQQAQALAQTGLNAATAEFNAIMGRIQANGGVVSAQDRKDLEAVLKKQQANTVVDSTAQQYWKNAISDTTQTITGQINAGKNLSDVQSNISALAADRDAYLEQIKKNYAEQASTMQWVIAANQANGWGLNIPKDAMSTLDQARTAAMDQVNRQYDAVLQTIVDTYRAQYQQMRKPLEERLSNAMKGIGIQSDFDVVSLTNQLYELQKEYEQLIATITGRRVNTGFGGSFASGGFPEAGQLFMANEAGAEYVGSFGNKTAVANTEQIVQGIARGVSDANQEQNALLRRQNELLFGILQNSGQPIQLDGATILRSTEKAAYNRGTTFSPVGVY